MTRHIAFALALTVCASLAGCAAEGSDDVDVVTASLGDQDFVLTEIRGDDGFIEVDVYYAVAQSEEIAHEVFVWPAVDPIPAELLERLRSVDPAILATAQPLRGELDEPTIDLGAAWPRILMEARLSRDDVRVSAIDLCERSGLADCQMEAN